MRKILEEFAKTTEHEKFVRGMIYGEFENQIKRIAKTIYPLSSCTIIKSKLISMPEGGEDREVEDEDFDIVEIDVERSRKSEIRRTERINVKKYAQQKQQEEESEKESDEEESEEEEE
jgi:TATA-binding protein-associated factor Taf7